MLRQSFMNKYKEKSKFGEERFLKEDEGYLLKESRPIKNISIQRLNKAKMDQFIEDIMTNKKLTSVLYPSNAKIEIKTYIETKKNFYHKSDEIKRKRKERNEPSSVVKKRVRREAYIQMREEIDNYNYNKERYKRSLTLNNNKKLKNIREEIKKQKEEYNKDIKSNYINGFRRSFSRLKFKLDLLKVPQTTNENFLLTEVDYPFLNEFTNKDIYFADPTLDIKDVYSRLYNNVILLPKDDKSVAIKKRAFSAKIRKRSNIEQNRKKQPKFNLKNVLNSNEGKEFTIQVTSKIVTRCYDKYSGGPVTIKYLKNPVGDKKSFSKDSYYVNYYDLVDPKTGNTFLHLATIDNCPQLIQYFIKKGANLNVQNNEGNTPLHLASKDKKSEIIRLLIDNKAALDIPNNKGDIPYEFFTSEMKREFGIDKILVINPIKKK